MAKLSAVYAYTPSPETMFRYIYAILNTPQYRLQYGEFLKRDFPRIPFPSDCKLFSEIAASGSALVALHLLESASLEEPICRFEGKGNNSIGSKRGESLRYDDAANRLYINSTQYFAPLALVIWQFRIGGYQICEKWLKDRKGERLGADEIRTFCRIATALAKTIELQGVLDVQYERIEAQTIQFEKIGK